MAWLAAVVLLAIPIVLITARILAAERTESFQTFVLEHMGTCYVPACRTE